jgi:hypothetical protein
METTGSEALNYALRWHNLNAPSNAGMPASGSSVADAGGSHPDHVARVEPFAKPLHEQVQSLVTASCRKIREIIPKGKNLIILQWRHGWSLNGSRHNVSSMLEGIGLQAKCRMPAVS